MTTIGERVAEHLAVVTLSPGGAGLLDEIFDGIRVSLQADEITRQGVTLRSLTVTDMDAMLQHETLKARASKLASKLRYLSEPIQLIEHDKEGSVALLRSSPPDRYRDRITYFEIRFKPHALSLQRLRHGQGETDVQSYTLSLEHLVRVVDDLAVTLRQHD